MGKGFNNYMCKKFFHPASADNLRRVYQAQKKADAENKKQADLRAQYDKEQELYNNKALLSKESKERLEVNFMYEPPPGVKKFTEEKDEEGGEPEFKFEWQRTWGHAPRESHLQAGDKVVEQPFGIQVCEAKCIKCGKFGHMNTDKRCPLYGKAVDHEAPIQNIDQDKLIQEMRAEGLAMRWSAWDMNKAAGAGAGNKESQMVHEEKPKPAAPSVNRAEVLKNMSKEEKKALLKKLEKMGKDKKKKKHKKEKKKKKASSDSDSDSDDDRKYKSDKRRSDSRDRNRDRRDRDRSDSRDRRGRDRSRSREDRRHKRDSSRDRHRRRSRSDERRERRRS